MSIHEELDRMVFRALTKVEQNRYYSEYVITVDGYFIERFAIENVNDNQEECDNKAIARFRREY